MHDYRPRGPDPLQGSLPHARRDRNGPGRGVLQERQNDDQVDQRMYFHGRRVRLVRRAARACPGDARARVERHEAGAAIPAPFRPGIRLREGPLHPQSQSALPQPGAARQICGPSAQPAAHPRADGGGAR